MKVTDLYKVGAKYIWEAFEIEVDYSYIILLYIHNSSTHQSEHLPRINSFLDKYFSASVLFYLFTPITDLSLLICNVQPNRAKK